MSEKKWAVINRPANGDGDEFVTVCKSKDAAIANGRDLWRHLTSKEQDKRDIIVGLISVNEDGEPWAEDENGLIDGDIYEIAYDCRLGNLKDRYASVMWGDKEYTLTDQAYADNYDGDTCYFAIAITGERDEDGDLLKYQIRWNETEEWQKQSEIHKELYGKKVLFEQGDGDPLTEAEKGSLHDAETYLQDEERACDWNDPADVCLI